jgi:hypothetical protein
LHNSRRHSAEECREIWKLAEQFCKEQKQQPRHDGSPPRQREGKQHVAREANDKEEMEFQNTKRVIKVIYGHSNSESSDNERRKQLHVIYGGS